MFDKSKPWFHWRDGMYFQRQPDGTVSIAKTVTPSADESGLAWCFDVPAAEWASIVASVSAVGETGETYRAAEAFHRGEKLP